MEPGHAQFRELRRLVGIIGVLCWVACSAVQAQVDLRVEPEPMRVLGRLDADTRSFTRNLRLTALGGTIPDLQLLSSDLVLVGDPAVVIEASQVRIPSGLQLSAGSPRDVPVTISDVPRPGTYEGRLEFPLPGPPANRLRIVAIVAEIGEVPRVVPVRSERMLNVVLCGLRLWCWFADRLVPGRMDGVVEFAFENETGVAATILAVRRDLQGAETRQLVLPAALPMELPQSLPASDDGVVMMAVDPVHLEPDTYQGSLRFRIEGLESAVPVGLTLNVRSSPFWAMLALLLGMVVGRLREWAKDGTDLTWTGFTSRLSDDDKKNWFGASIAWVLGILTGRFQTTLGLKGFVKRFVFVMLLFALFVLGLTTLYSANVAFGAKGLGDYLGLFIWGFGADVTQLTLNK